MIFARIAAVLAVLLITGCGSNPMKVSEVTTIKAPDSSEAQVVFMRSSFVGSAISASLYDVTNGEPKFIGIIENGTKVPYSVDSGKHVFMVVAESADYMEADINAGKTYYSIVTPRMGVWKARFSLWPIKKSSTAEYTLDNPEVQGWIKETKLATLSEAAETWFTKNKASIVKKHDKYWPTWLSNTPEETATRTLSPEDGQ